MINIVFLDLDGTILDGKERHYQCYIEIVKYDGQPLSQDIYWRMKRGKVSLDKILEMSQYRNSKEFFINEWISKIEGIDYLKYDKLKPNVKKTLIYFKTYGFKVMLVTMRRNKENLISQLTDLNIIDCFDEVFCCETEKYSKYEMVKNIKYDNAVFIGDTEDDINTARLLNIKSIAILNGLREIRFLKEANYFFDEIEDISIEELL